MAKTAISELRQQIAEVRREAFAAGYAAAMQAIRELASRSAPVAESSAPRRRRDRGRVAPAMTPSRQRGARTTGDAARRRSATRRPRRGANAQMIEEILQSAVPRALRPADIRKALQEKGLEVAFTSIRHALSQLETRDAAEQVGNSRTWRYSGGPA